MSYKIVVFSAFLLLVVFCVNAVNKQKMETSSNTWPCPDETDIYPCFCIYDNINDLLELDCSEVTSENNLQKILGQQFPIDIFDQFIMIRASNETHSLKSLPQGVFGNKIFRNILISETNITNIDPEIFDNMINDLNTIAIHSNLIQEFPCDTSSFSKLQILDLHQNLLTQINVTSASILSVNLVNNNIESEYLYVDATTSLESIYLDNNMLTEVPDLNAHSQLKVFSLSGNTVSMLRNDEFEDYPSLTDLNLDDNEILDITSTSFSGPYGSGLIVSLKKNLITTLEYETWNPLINVLDRVALHLEENMLLCGCEIEWLFEGSGVTQPVNKISPSTTCSDGTLIYEVDEDVFGALC